MTQAYAKTTFEIGVFHCEKGMLVPEGAMKLLSSKEKAVLTVPLGQEAATLAQEAAKSGQRAHADPAGTKKAAMTNTDQLTLDPKVLATKPLAELNLMLEDRGKAPVEDHAEAVEILSSEFTAEELERQKAAAEIAKASTEGGEAPPAPEGDTTDNPETEG